MRTAARRSRRRRYHQGVVPATARKRPIDVVLMSIGGNDVGFGALAAYSLTENVADLARSPAWSAARSASARRCRASISTSLDERMKAVQGRAASTASASRRRGCVQILLRADPLRRDRRAVRRAADAWAWTCIPACKVSQRAPAARPRISCGDFLRAARMHRHGKSRAGCPGRSGDRPECRAPGWRYREPGWCAKT